MTSVAKKILEEGLASQREREEFVSARSCRPDLVELSPERNSEIARRIRKLECCDAKFLDVEEHLAELKPQRGF
jgi:hypothetical protein